MSERQAFREAAKICRRHARDYNSLSSQISREPNKKWISKATKWRCVSEFAGIAVEMLCVAHELDNRADKISVKCRKVAK